MRKTRPILIAAAAGAVMLTGAALMPAAGAQNIDYTEASRQLMTQGEIALVNDDSFGALMLYEQAIVANPRNSDAYVGLGRAHVALGNIGLSLKYFGIALEIDPTHLGALEGQALSQLKRDKVADAEKALTKIKRICGEKDCAERERVTDAIAAYLEEHVAGNNG